jgi:hypothetical protein
MKRYILRYQGKGAPPDQDHDRIRNIGGLKVLDASSPHMYLVEATETAARQLEQMPSWTVSPETVVPLPDTRKKIRQSP